MKRQNKSIKLKHFISNRVRKKIELGGERIWRLSDFEDMSFTAVAQVLSRLCQTGFVQRLGKGLYYRSRETIFGKSKSSQNQLLNLSNHRKGIFPSGNAAANLLGFSTQNTTKLEFSTNGLSFPRLLVGKEAIVHASRPESWMKLSIQDVALLEFIREGGKHSELSLEETHFKLIEYFRKPDQFERLFQVFESEPPRVRAILGAIGEEINCSKKHLYLIRKSINSLSRFNFGKLIKLKHAKQWQAKERTNEII